jgi:inositol-phosphate phosphatase / L-galactose 1-phosphate phosphatase / histidinol-phosphatase
MPDYNIEELAEFANKLADASGAVIRKYYRNFGAIQAKGDLSPVTIADMEAEKAIKELINQHYPEHGIQGEEFGIENKDAPFKWVIDPIDGTVSFMIGRPIFGTLISLLYKEKTILGVIDQPIAGERWVGVEGFQAQLNGKDISVRKCSSLADVVFCTTGPQYFKDEKLTKFNAITDAVKYTIYGGDCYNHALLSMGMIDAVVESGLKIHDFMAVKVVVEQAGGIATDWHGKPLDMNSDGDVVFSGDERVHKEILEMLK